MTDEKSTAIEKSRPKYIDDAIEHYGEGRLRLLKDTIGKDLTTPELAMFVEVCKRSGLDPFSKQIYAVKRYDKRLGRDVMTIQTGIDGFRAIAERTGKYSGQNGPWWCGEDGVWKEVWLEKKPPMAAKIEVLRSDFQAPLVGTAHWDEYSQPWGLWQSLPRTMLAKCAESIALRRAFPRELSGLYTADEMSQADSKEQQYNPPRAQSKNVTTVEIATVVSEPDEVKQEEPKQEPEDASYEEVDAKNSAPTPTKKKRQTKKKAETKKDNPESSADQPEAKDSDDAEEPRTYSKLFKDAVGDMRTAASVAEMSEVISRYKPNLTESEDSSLRAYGRYLYAKSKGAEPNRESMPKTHLAFLDYALGALDPA